MAGKVVFETNFGAGVSLETPIRITSDPKIAFRSILGTDSQTGYSFPISFFDKNVSNPNQLTAIQYVSYYDMTLSNIDSYFSTSIETGIGPSGGSENYMQFQLLQNDPVDPYAYQCPFIIVRPHNIGDISDTYISYYCKYPSNLADTLDTNVPSGSSLVHFQFKTGGYNDTFMGDYRTLIYIYKDNDGSLFWLTRADNRANLPLSLHERDIYWEVHNREVSVPVGDWFKFELFMRRSPDCDGMFWAAVDGNVIVDKRGPNMGTYNLPVNRIMAFANYTGGQRPLLTQLARFKVMDGFPYGDTSLYNAKTFKIDVINGDPLT